MPEDFRSAIAAVGDNSLSDGSKDIEAQTHEGSDIENGELELVRRVMHVPGPEVDVQELRKSLGIAQLGFTQARAELNELKKKCNTLAARVPTCTQVRALKATGPVDSKITKAAKKYCILYHLWVPENLFLICLDLQLLDVDPQSPLHWSTAESQAAGNQAELYVMMPEELRKQMTIHSQFKSVVSYHS
ncbi:hypothetical protein BDN67DRAFT_985283 [Paxillus ammoniavirescens]|nr:hypothetical protein BDN67DRAFT_985283 [Paxillus ammoniavirescens]